MADLTLLNSVWLTWHVSLAVLLLCYCFLCSESLFVLSHVQKEKQRSDTFFLSQTFYVDVLIFIYGEFILRIAHGVCLCVFSRSKGEKQIPTLIFLTSEPQPDSWQSSVSGVWRFNSLVSLGFPSWFKVTSSLFLCFPSLCLCPFFDWSSTGLWEWILRSIRQPSSSSPPLPPRLNSLSPSLCALYMRLETEEIDKLFLQGLHISQMNNYSCPWCLTSNPCSSWF